MAYIIRNGQVYPIETSKKGMTPRSISKTKTGISNTDIMKVVIETKGDNEPQEEKN